jgi:methylmalonyl-CoA mutase
VAKRKTALENVAVYFNFKFFSIDFVKKIDNYPTEKAIAYYSLDPIGQLARDGNWFTTKDKNNFDSLNFLQRFQIVL